jgi:hypothetical protein
MRRALTSFPFVSGRITVARKAGAARGMGAPASDRAGVRGGAPVLNVFVDRSERRLFEAVLDVGVGGGTRTAWTARPDVVPLDHFV